MLMHHTFFIIIKIPINNTCMILHLLSKRVASCVKRKQLIILKTLHKSFMYTLNSKRSRIDPFENLSSFVYLNLISVRKLNYHAKWEMNMAWWKKESTTTNSYKYWGMMHLVNSGRVRETFLCVLAVL